VTGDLAECVDAPGASRGEESVLPASLTDADKLDWQYIQGVLDIYAEAAPMMKAESVDAGDAKDFSVRLFMYMAEFHLGNMLDKALSKNLREVRDTIETIQVKAETAYANKDMSPKEFVDDFDQITIKFQDEMASVMKPEQYRTVFDLQPDERIVLADREIVKTAFGIE
jgi:hypothetical protein